MKKFLIKISTVAIVAIMLCFSLSGCSLFDFRPKLATPDVKISGTGLAVWGEVDGALYYVYVIDSGEEQVTGKCSVQLVENQTIKVKAISGDDNYADSAYSAPQTYTKRGPVVEQEHSDVNGDGICDECGESVTVELSFYAVNDLHGKYMDTDSQPGVDEFTTYMKNLYKDDAREEILLASGDMWQGTVESSSNKGQLMTEWMNDLGFVSMTLGNHEYDWGSDVFETNKNIANFPFLAINITYYGSKVDYCKASTIVERGGVKIGIIGAIGNCLSSISGDFTDGLRFATGSSLTALVADEATRLREQEGCDIIVYSIHDGGEGFESWGINQVSNYQLDYYDTILSDGYVDLVFEAHTHQSYILQDEYGVYHLQGGGENRGISCADVTYNTANKSISVSPRIIDSGVYGYNPNIEGDPVVEQIFNKYFPESNPYTDVLGNNSSYKSSNSILKTLAELYYQKGVEVWGSQYNIVLGGGYLNARSPYNIYAGPVHYADIFSILPFDNEIVLGKVSGSSLINLLNRNNYTLYYTIDSSSIDRYATYYIIVDSYTSTYSSNNITEVARLGSGTYPRDLLADFISSGGWA